MTTLPTMMATTAASIFATTAVANQTADFNNDGNIDAMDLITLTSALNLACDNSCPTDINQDGVTDTMDLNLLMGLWGPVPGWVPSEETTSDTPETEGTPFQRDPNRDMSWQNEAPVLLDAIYFDQYTELFHHGGYDRWHNAQAFNQGEHTMSWLSSNNVAMQPMVYGGVDWNHDNFLTADDKESFKVWLDATIPADYDGPLCLDLEGQWWSMLDTQSQTVMDIAINFYLENIEYAKELRPNAKIGFWGFPKKTHSNPDINTASVQRLLNACTAIFPDVYENNPNGNDAARLQLHLERCIEMVNGEIPVYAQVSPRYKKDSSGYRYFHTQEEFLRDQVEPSLAASWTDANGQVHRVSSVSFWEAYVYISMYTDNWSEMSMSERKAAWDELDYAHIDYLKDMKAAVAVAAAQFVPPAPITEDVQVATLEPASVQDAAPLLGIVEKIVETVPLITPEPSFVDSKTAYRSAQKSWKAAKRTFAKAKRKNKRGTEGYKAALATYKHAKANFKSASKLYQSSKKSTKSARAKMNKAKTKFKSKKKSKRKSKSKKKSKSKSKKKKGSRRR